MRDDGKTLHDKVYKGWTGIISKDTPCPLKHDWIPDAFHYRCETCGWVIDYEAVIKFLVEERYLQ